MTDQAATPEVIAEPLIDRTEFEAILVEILDALVVNAGMDLEAPIAGEPGIEATPLTGSIVVHAGVRARLVIDTDAEACATLARCWGLSGSGQATAADGRDALAELCNLVGATVKTVFEEESHVGIPEAREGTGPVWESQEITLRHQTGTFVARFGLD